MVSSARVSWALALVVALSSSYALASPADPAPYLDSLLLRVDVVADGKAGCFTVWKDALTPDALGKPEVKWGLDNVCTIRSADNTALATLNDLSASFFGDPQVGLNFSFTAGGAPVTITLTSSTVSFAGIQDPQAWASANITLTDNAGSGASRSGQYAGPKSYKAFYNGSSIFALLVGDQSVGSDESDALGQSASGTIAGSVSSIASSFSFQISANASASGNSVFEVLPTNNVPEPSSLLALGAGLVGVLRQASRRRA